MSGMTGAMLSRPFDTLPNDLGLRGPRKHATHATHPTPLESPIMTQPPFTWRLHDLPFVARLVIAVFLCSVGLGYLAAIVQVNVQDAPKGELMPGPKDLIDKYHGKEGISTIERLITADVSKPFSASGTMQPAFTTKSGGWADALTIREHELAEKDQKDFDALAVEEQDKYIASARAELRKERKTEMLVMAHWIHNGLDKKAYEDDFYPLPEELRDQPITKDMATKNGDMQGVKIYKLVNSRCVRCHTDARRADADFAPLNEYWKIKAYTDKSKNAGAISILKLAQTTHVHLLGFSMLYFLTGFLLAMTGWPAIIRFVIAPLALLAQIAEIACWWLGRLDDPYGSMFAQSVAICGGIVGLVLALQIVMTLLSLFGKFGKMVVVLLLLAAIAGAGGIFELKIKGYLADEAQVGAVEK